MFNDDVQMGFFDVYDQFLVNMLYDPRVRPGMTKDEVNALLPDIFPTVRTWVTNAGSSRGEESQQPLWRSPTITAQHRAELPIRKAGTASERADLLQRFLLSVSARILPTTMRIP